MASNVELQSSCTCAELSVAAMFSFQAPQTKDDLRPQSESIGGHGQTKLDVRNNGRVKVAIKSSSIQFGSTRPKRVV